MYIHIYDVYIGVWVLMAINWLISGRYHFRGPKRHSPTEVDGGTGKGEGEQSDNIYASDKELVT